MTSKLIPSDPEAVTVIRNVTPNIITCSAPFHRFGHFKVGGRGTIVRLSNSTLAVFSPTALTPSVHAALTSLNAPVAYLVAPDIEHHIFLADWHKAFPSAHVVGPEGLAEKRAAQPTTTNVPFTTVFKTPSKPPAAGENPQAHTPLGSDAAFNADFDYEYVYGHPSKELVFFYKPDRTLIEADLLFNLPPTEQYSKVSEQARKLTLADRLFGALQSTAGTAVWQKRFLWYVVSRNDRQAFNASIQRINGWDFQRIIPCHGDVIEENGKGIFQKVLAWHLAGTQAAKTK